MSFNHTFKCPTVIVEMNQTGDVGDLNIFPCTVKGTKIRKSLRVKRHLTFAFILQFLRKFALKNSQATLYVFVANAFMPSSDALIGDLFDNFATGDKLVVNYATVNAWG